MNNTLNKLFKIYVVMMIMLLSFSEYMVAKYIIIALSIATFTLIMFTFFNNTNTINTTNNTNNNLITKVNIYRGMTESELNNIIENVNYNLDENDLKILKMFYVERKELFYIAQSLSYSVDNIQKRKTKTLELINKYYKDNKTSSNFSELNINNGKEGKSITDNKRNVK